MAIDGLMKELPLGDSWSVPEVFTESVRIGGLTLHLVGLTSKNEEGFVIQTSAADLKELPWNRAYYELLERISIIEAESKSTFQDTAFASFLINGEDGGVLVGNRVFPEDYLPYRKLSKSNGVACHTNARKARMSAWLELVERDSILQSWDGYLKPRQYEGGDSEIADRLKDIYRIAHFLFSDANSSEGELIPVVAGSFLFPLLPENPLVFGFGSETSPALAVNKATGECLQRLGFLYGEAPVREIPIFSPTPSYHQDVFLHPEALPEIQSWLAGGRQQKTTYARPPTENSQVITYADLTPNRFRGKIFVFRAISEFLRPLSFGISQSGVLPAHLLQAPWRKIHPIA